MLAQRQEQILLKAPVQESTHPGANADDLKSGYLSDFSDGFFRGGNEAILGVVVQKDFEGIASLNSRGRLAAGKQHFSKLVGVQIETGGGFTQDAKGMSMARFDHCWRIACLFEEGQGEASLGGRGVAGVLWSCGMQRLGTRWKLL